MAIQKIAHEIDTFDIENLGIRGADLADAIIVSGKIGSGAVLSGNVVTRSVRFTDIEEATFYALGGLSDGHVVYADTAGWIGCAVVNVSGQMPAVGVVDGAVASGILTNVKTLGIHRSANYNFSGYVGRQAYVSSTSGAIATWKAVTSGQYQSVGLIVNASSLLLAIGPVQQL